MQATFNLSQLLYANTVPIPFMKNDPDKYPKSVIGQKGEYEQGLCIGHSGVGSEKHFAKISSVAMFLNEVIEGNLSCAVGQGRIYGEVKREPQNVRFLYENGKIVFASMPQGSYWYSSTATSSIFVTIPVVLNAIMTEPNIGKYFTDFQKTPSMETVLRFCDGFWNDYATRQNEVTADDGLDLNQIKTAYRTGKLTDKSYMFGTEPCEVFQKVEPRYKFKTPQEMANSMTEFQNGSRMISYSWNDEQQSRVRPLRYLDEFVPTNTFFKVMKKLDLRLQSTAELIDLEVTDIDAIKSNFVNMLFYGDPGTGKTVLANALSAATGLPIYEITCNEDSEDDEFEGKNKIVDGKLSFVETAFLEGFEKGGIILMEEINLARANILTSVMNQALEYPYMIKKNGYQRITRHPLCVMIGTMNLDTEGTTSLNSALAQRFLFKYQIEEPNEQEFLNVLKKKGYLEQDCKYVYYAYKKIRDNLKTTDQKRRFLKELSIRQCEGALASMQEGIDPEEAIMDSMYGALAVRNKKLADTVRDSIISTLVNYDTFVTN